MTEGGPLLPFEDEHFHGTLKKYFIGKRGAFFNTVEAFPEIWKAFEMLDGLWTRSLEHISSQGDQSRVLPALLFFNAHARIRIAFELGFSRCLPEAFGALRSAIESAAYAYQFIREPCDFPKLAAASARQGTRSGDQERISLIHDLMKRAFDKRKKNWFMPADIVGKLGRAYGMCSEWGSHLTFGAVATRVQQSVGGQPLPSGQLGFAYADATPQATQAVLTWFLDCGYQMHDVLFRSFESRLKLDTELPRLCNEFRQLKNHVAGQLDASVPKEFERRGFKAPQ